MKNKAQLDGMPVWFDGKSINEALFCDTHKTPDCIPFLLFKVRFL